MSGAGSLVVLDQQIISNVKCRRRTDPNGGGGAPPLGLVCRLHFILSMRVRDFTVVEFCEMMKSYIKLYLIMWANYRQRFKSVETKKTPKFQALQIISKTK